jgi:hypothetical protein
MLILFPRPDVPPRPLDPPPVLTPVVWAGAEVATRIPKNIARPAILRPLMTALPVSGESASDPYLARIGISSWIGSIKPGRNLHHKPCGYGM